MSLQPSENRPNLSQCHKNLGQNSSQSNQMQEPSPESEPESPRAIPSLMIIHEPARCGGPFGVFSATCQTCILGQCSFEVKVLMVLPGRGYLAQKLRKDLQLYAVNKGLPWFDCDIDMLLGSLADLISEDFSKVKFVHYATMEMGG